MARKQASSRRKPRTPPPPDRPVVSRDEALRRVEAVAERIHRKIRKARRPELKIPVRSLSNVRYDPEAGHFEILGREATRTLSVNTVKTFAQSVRLLAATKEILETHDIAGKREVYYNSKSWGECRFQEQPESDSLLDDIEAMLAVNREQLGYIPEEHGGDVVGPLLVADRDPASGEEIVINCMRLGSGAWSIPSQVEHLRFRTSGGPLKKARARFILAIETASLFQRLVHHRYFETAGCILISMSGVPSRACRRFIRRLSDDQDLPVLVFTDGDPYGYGNIYRTLKVGSGQAAHINRFFCVPRAQFLGVTPQDIIDYDLQDATHPLEPVDIKRARDALKNDPFVRHHKEWQQALKQMLEMGVRVEQQAFAKHGLNYVLDTYLPDKLRRKTFLP